MTSSKIVGSLALVTALSLTLAPSAQAQRRGGGGGGSRGGTAVRGGGGGVAIPRAGVGGSVVEAPRIISPQIVGYGAYRPYYYYRPGISIGFYGGFGFGYPYYYPYGYAYPYPYYYGYPYAYPYSYGYPAYSYPPSYSYPPQGYPPQGYPPQGYPQAGDQQPPAQGSVTTQQQPAVYGGVRVEGAPRDAQVYVDGYYAGIVDDFDGTDKHLNLTSGTHQVEIRINGQQPVAFDVNVPPNQTITVRVP